MRRKVHKQKVNCSRCSGLRDGKSYYCRKCRAAYARENRTRIEDNRQIRSFNEGLNIAIELAWSHTKSEALMKELRGLKKILV